jgi:flagellar motor switch protein FliG
MRPTADGAGQEKLRRRSEQAERRGEGAIVLLALGEDHHQLWQSLDEDEIKEISQAMSTLGTVTSGVVEQLLVEFVSDMNSGGSIMGSFEQTQKLLASFLPEGKVDQMMEEIRGPAGPDHVGQAGQRERGGARGLPQERVPADRRVVLSKIRAEHASRVLANLPEDFALECVMRMLRMEPVQKDILDKIELTLRNEFMSNLARTSKRDAHEQMADIFNNFDRTTETAS